MSYSKNLGEVEHDWEDEDASDVHPGVVHGAQVGGLVRVTDGDVAVQGDQDGHVDGARLRDKRARVDIFAQVWEHGGEPG